jgi:hypothetical protein
MWAAIMYADKYLLGFIQTTGHHQMMAQMRVQMMAVVLNRFLTITSIQACNGAIVPLLLMVRLYGSGVVGCFN